MAKKKIKTKLCFKDNVIYKGKIYKKGEEVPEGLEKELKNYVEKIEIEEEVKEEKEKG